MINAEIAENAEDIEDTEIAVNAEDTEIAVNAEDTEIAEDIEDAEIVSISQILDMYVTSWSSLFQNCIVK